MASGALDQDSFRSRNNDGNETTATWRKLVNVDDTLLTDVTYRLRLLVQEYAGASFNNVDLEFQYNLNGAGWNDITTTSSVVKAVASGTFTDEEDCTQQIGSGNFETSNEGMTEDGISGGGALDISANYETETELSFQIVSGDVADTDTIEIRLTRDGGNLLDLYTRTPTLMVSEPTTSPISAFTTLTFSEAAILKGSGALVATSDLTFSENAVLEGKTSLIGSSALTFSTSASLSGKIFIFGTVDLIFSESGVLKGIGNLGAATDLTFSESALLKGKAFLSGIANIIFTESAVLIGKMFASGTTILDFSESGNLEGVGDLLAISTMTFSEAGVLKGHGALNAQTALIFTATGIISGGAVGDISGQTDLIFTEAAILKGKGSLNAVSDLTFTEAAILKGKGSLNAFSDLIFTGVGDLTAAEDLTGLSELVFSTFGQIIGKQTIDIFGNTLLNFTLSGDLTDAYVPVGGIPIDVVLAIQSTLNIVLTTQNDHEFEVTVTEPDIAILSGRE